jgi:hypothetical protein
MGAKYSLALLYWLQMFAAISDWNSIHDEAKYPLKGMNKG